MQIQQEVIDGLYFDDKIKLNKLTPTVDILSGGDDAFQSVIVKFNGHKVFMSQIYDTDIAGKRSCSECWFHVIPFSLGFETDRNIENLNAIAEAGYFPVGEAWEGKSRFGLSGTRIGLFLQGGYKIDIDETTAATGGSADESKEDPDDEIFRIKAEANTILGDSDDLVNFIPALHGWYDISNSETYYSIEAVVRFNIINRHFDVRYEKGSGAPNFNEGRQISAGMTMSF
jgi:hypothetical protein